MSNIRNMNEDNKSDSTIKNEVRKLVKEGYNIDSNLVNYLKSKYSDSSIVDVILDEFKQRKVKLEKIANHFIRKFQEKFGSGMNMNVILKKILKYKKRYELSDDEFDNVKRMFEKKLYNENISSYNENINFDNNLGKVLGSPYSFSGDSLKPSSNDDFKNVQEIIKHSKVSKPLYSQIVLQTSTYKLNDFRPVDFDINKNSPHIFVHPVLAALFIPKFKEVEYRMLYSNIGEIVECRYERRPIDTEPNSRLLYYLVNDPSDIVCSSRSALDDLRERVYIQIQLWQNVMNLRNGKIYDTASFDFLSAIDKCKISNFDNPDLIMLGDEGVVLRRLFNVFSFRPIVVQTIPFVNNFNNNPYNIPMMNNVISTIPYITHRLSPFGENFNQQVLQVNSNPGVAIPNFNVHINNGYNPFDVNVNNHIGIDKNKPFIQYFLENNIFVLKLTSVLYLYGPLIFYIPRRSINVPIVLPPSIRNLPITKYSNLNINKTVITYNNHIRFESNNNKYDLYLQSSVSVNYQEINNVNNVKEEMISGNSTHIFEYDNETIKNVNNDLNNLPIYPLNIYKYSPQSVLNKYNMKKAYFKISHSDLMLITTIKDNYINILNELGGKTVNKYIGYSNTTANYKNLATNANPNLKSLFDGNEMLIADVSRILNNLKIIDNLLIHENLNNYTNIINNNIILINQKMQEIMRINSSLALGEIYSPVELSEITALIKGLESYFKNYKKIKIIGGIGGIEETMAKYSTIMIYDKIE